MYTWHDEQGPSFYWRPLHMHCCRADAANEAKDNVKYLATLEKSLEPLYIGTPQMIIESLPTMMNNIAMMHTIARYYNTPERMTVLFQKVGSHPALSSRYLWPQQPVADNLQLGALLLHPTA